MTVHFNGRVFGIFYSLPPIDRWEAGWRHPISKLRKCYRMFRHGS